MVSQIFSRRAALLALVLLSLPGPAWAQAVLSGQVRSTNGSGAAGVTVVARRSSVSQGLRATTDANGMYQLPLSPGVPYEVAVELSGQGFTGTYRVISYLMIWSATVRNLQIPDLWLHGRVLDTRGQPVAGAKLAGVSHVGTNQVVYTLSAVSGADGRFQVRILDGWYASMRVEPPANSGYGVTPLADAVFTASGTPASREYRLSDATRLSGQLRFSDGSVAAGALVYARASVGTYFAQTLTDAAGMYELSLGQGTYHLGAEFTGPGYTGSQRLVTGLVLSSSQLVYPLTFSDILLSGQVLSRTTFQPAAGVVLRGSMNGDRPPLSLNDLTVTSGADGRFQVRILPGAYFFLELDAPAGSGYLDTELQDQTFSSSGHHSFYVSTPVYLTGQVRFSDWIGVAGATVTATSSDFTATTTADAGGVYRLPLLASSSSTTYRVDVTYSVPGFHGTQTVLPSLWVGEDRVRDLPLSDVWLQGRTVNGNGEPMAGVRLSGKVYRGDGEYNSLAPVSGADGRFAVRVLPGSYSSLRLEPPSGTTGYRETPLPDEFITGPLTKDFVLDDIDECLQNNNGGCSVNATCTNLEGSHVCACKSGYSGDGYTCVETPKTLTLTAPNGGEQWTSGTVRDITWTSSAVSSVHLHYSLDNGTMWALIAANMPAAPGSYAWTLPSGITSTSARVRIVDAQAGTPVDMSDAAFAVTSPGRIILNEILANEPGSATSGEFIELVNVGGSSINVGGWTLWDATAARHSFAQGTVLAPGQALVVFGSASGVPAGMPNAVGASTGSLSLNNTGDTVSLRDAGGASVDAFTYSSALCAVDGVSMNLSPEATPGSGFVLHNSVSVLPSSAGRRVDGTAF